MDPAIIDAAYAAMKASPMANWVGDGDPEHVGRSSFHALADNVPLDEQAWALDFGCGIGRTTVVVAEALHQGKVVGLDIVKDHIDFCRQEIGSRFSNCEFFVISDHNPHYDHLIPDVPDPDSMPPEEFADRHRGAFSLIYAFSVFTHFTPDMARKYLPLFNPMLKNNGTVFLTCFLNQPTNPEDRRLHEGEPFRDCVESAPLLFSVFDINCLAGLCAEAGLRIRRIVFGHWRGVRGNVAGVHYQDIVILEKIAVLPPDFDPARYIALNSDLEVAGANPVEHYLAFGFYEDRRYR